MTTRWILDFPLSVTLIDDHWLKGHFGGRVHLSTVSWGKKVKSLSRLSAIPHREELARILGSVLAEVGIKSRFHKRVSVQGTRVATIVF